MNDFNTDLLDGYPFDFCVKLDNLVINCLHGGDSVEILKAAMQREIEWLDSGDHIKYLNQGPAT